MILTVKAMYLTQKGDKIQKRVNDKNVNTVLDDIDAFISKNMDMKQCDIVAVSDEYGFRTTVSICKKFDIFDLYSLIEHTINHYIRG